MKLLLPFILFIGLASCKQEIKYQKTDSGIEYFYFEKSNKGAYGKPGYYYLVNMIGQRDDDSTFLNSYTSGKKMKLIRTLPSQHSLFNDALGMLRIGDSIVFRIPTDSFFAPLGYAIPNYLRNTKNIRFTLKVNDILDPEAHLSMMYVNEYEQMEAFVKSKKWKYSNDTLTGIKYEILTKGNSNKAQAGDEVEVLYYLTYLNGKIIIQSNPGDKIRVGSIEHIPGLSRLVLLGSEGAKIRAVLPFAEGYGRDGSNIVDEYATLLVEMEIVKIYKK